MGPLTIKHGDKHDVRLVIAGAPLSLSGGTAKVQVAPSVGGAAQQFDATLSGADTVIWTLDGTLAPGRYKLEVQVTVGGSIVTAPSDGYMELVVLADLA